ncbi:hypothetical protein FRC11_005300 [Ceratobasidium sp. 423]|nr:hypothetical protein FRC11_005300 [Ceratobasidium sp. 423]
MAERSMQPRLVGYFIKEYLPRSSLAATIEENGYSSIQVTTFVNGMAIPDGVYKILVRALKVTGNAKAEKDYE